MNHLSIIKKFIFLVIVFCVGFSAIGASYGKAATVTESYSYDQMGRLTQVIYEDAQNTSSISYEYSSMDNIVKAALEEHVSSLLLLVLPALMNKTEE